MAGYGTYEGVGGLPYSVGGTGGMGSSDAQGVSQTEGQIPMGTQAQGTQGAYGAASYQSMMPQWMQDYFDAHVAGQGYDSINAQRNLGTEGLEYLKSRYGEKAAMNPYFTQGAGYGKGFDPFHYGITETTTGVEAIPGRDNPYMPDWMRNQYKTTHTQKDPFSGAQLGQSYTYSPMDPPRPQDKGGGNNFDWMAAGLGTAVLGPVGGLAGFRKSF